MANNFRWFNQQAYTDNSNADSPSYVPQQEGALSILGRTLQGIAAPFAGDFQFNQRQAEIQIRQQQADQEFQALLMKNALQKQALKNGKNVYTINPMTGEMEYGGQVGSGDIVRTVNPLDQQVEAQKAKELAKGVPVEQYGKVELAKEALKNLDKVEATLYPKGLDSFRRDIASSANMPVLGGPVPFNKDAQNVFRQLSTSLGGRTLIETGVASSADERKKKAMEFMVNFGSDPSAFKDALDQNREFYKGYLNTVGSRGQNLKEEGYGNRLDGTEKGTGFLGELKRPDGNVSTEITVGVNIGGKEMDIPTLVPTLNKNEIDYLLAGNKPTKEIVQKAVEHAKSRISNGQSVFANSGKSQGKLNKDNLFDGL